MRIAYCYSMAGNSNNKRKVFGKNPDITFEFPANGAQNEALLRTEKKHLINISEVFEKQFLSELNEENEKIVIKDISFDTFSQMIEYSYDGYIIIHEQNYLEMLYAAKKYFYYDMINKIAIFLLNFITASNLANHYECIEKFELKSVMDHITKICIKDPLKVISQLSFAKPHMRILKTILESPCLPCTEYVLYDAIVKMMKLQLEDEPEKMHGEIMRKNLGPLIFLIRFPTMSVDELFQCAKSPTPLKPTEFLDFILWSYDKTFSELLLHYSLASRINL